MKFSLELPIHKSRAEVWKIFDNPENTKIRQPTLTKIETLSGTQGRPGAISKLTYSEGTREFALLEKVLHRDEPNQFDSVYENNFADNTVKNSFSAVSENGTLWKVAVEYKFKTLLMKVVGPIMKRNFVARTKREMEEFKELAEKN